MAPEQSRKRLYSESTARDPSTMDTMTENHIKRQRQEDVAKFTPALVSSTFYVTPPCSAPSTSTKPTLSLALKIPKHVPDAKEKRDLASRKGAAKRWVPKLQGSFPKEAEIKRAYPLKLMRHYPLVPAPAGFQSVGTPAPVPTALSASTSSSSSASATITPDANFVKPMIHKSARVSKLLKTFPALNIPATTSAPMTAQKLTIMGKQELNKLHGNKLVTISQEAVKLAWKGFAKPHDNPRVEAMVESALPLEELEKEHQGVTNKLPEWKKWRTSKFLVGDAKEGNGKGKMTPRDA
jgi:hypothetical protein